MKNFFKGKLVTALVVVATVILAGVAIFTALRLYQLREEAVAPNAPETPFAAAPIACEVLNFTITQNTPTVTPTGSLSPTPTLSPTVTPTQIPGTTATPTEIPELTSTPTPTESAIGGGDLPSSTPTPTRVATSTPTGQTIADENSNNTPTPSGDTLPNAGSSVLTIAGFGFGVLLITFALLLAI